MRVLTKEVTKEAVLATRLTKDIQKLVEQLARIQGLKPSEYLRNLILEDMERRSLITARLANLKETIENEHRGSRP